MTTEEKIKEQIASNPIILYMKGTPENPECGFSGATVKALSALGHPFSYVNVLKAPFVRERLPSISHWPTFPQLFINGELVGGCDIVLELAASGELKTMLDGATAAT